MRDKLFDVNAIEELNKKISYILDNSPCLSDEDFYSPYANRTYKSNVEDIDGGDNFADYCEDFFEMLDQEEYFN